MATIISPDSFLYTEDGAYVFTQERAKEAWAKTRAAVEEAVEEALETHDTLVLLIGLPGAGKSTWIAENRNVREGEVVVDATFVKPEWRAPFIDLARDAGVPVEAVWFNLPVEVCQARNNERGLGRRVPDELYGPWSRILDTNSPSTDEGFRTVRIIYDPC